MLNPQGYATIIDPTSSRMVEERDTFSCAHCHKVIHVKPLTDPAAEPNGRCPGCEDGMQRGLICPNCVGKPCSNYFKRLEKEESEAQRKLACAMVL